MLWASLVVSLMPGPVEAADPGEADPRAPPDPVGVMFAPAFPPAARRSIPPPPVPSGRADAERSEWTTLRSKPWADQPPVDLPDPAGPGFAVGLGAPALLAVGGLAVGVVGLAVRSQTECDAFEVECHELGPRLAAAGTALFTAGATAVLLVLDYRRQVRRQRAWQGEVDPGWLRRDVRLTRTILGAGIISSVFLGTMAGALVGAYTPTCEGCSGRGLGTAVASGTFLGLGVLTMTTAGIMRFNHRP